jgi:transmembrane sensor
LNTVKNGVVSSSKQGDIVKLDSGSLSIKVNAGGHEVKDLAVAYNKIETPRGGQYKVELPDGTQVWLNAASSLRFPSLFSGNTRNVVLDGEGYFDVAINKNLPFTVTTDQSVITVLGTRFNVMAYQEEGVNKTTLLNGSVKISTSHSDSKILTPNEQATLRPAGEIEVNKHIDPSLDIAWVTGKFQFQKFDIQMVMRQISRWYNADIVYDGKPTELTFSASIDRSKNLSEILHLLEATGHVHFKIENQNNRNKIIVLP